MSVTGSYTEGQPYFSNPFKTSSKKQTTLNRSWVTEKSLDQEMSWLRALCTHVQEEEIFHSFP